MSHWWMMIFKEYVKTVSGVWNCEILLYQILYYQINYVNTNFLVNYEKKGSK